MNQENKITKLIAIYARVSTARQEEEQTINNQLIVLREFAEKNNFVIVKEYIDDGWSGTILARPQLDQLRQDARQKIWEAVLIYDPDRLARRYFYQELVRDELAEISIDMLFVTVPPSRNEGDRLLEGVRGVFAEYERERIKERFRLGKMRKIKEGHILTSEAPYGYNYIKRQDKIHGYYTVNEEEIMVVKMIFNWIVYDKLTIRGIVKKLQELEVQPRKSKRGVWSASTLGHLLRNTTYIGEAYYGKSYAVIPDRPINKEKYRKIKKTSRRSSPKENWYKIPTPATIDPELFAKAQKQIKENFELCKRNRKSDYLLSGKIWCNCGLRRAGEGAQKGKHLYYRCTSRLHNFPETSSCMEGGINARISDEMVWSKIVKLMSSPTLLKNQIERWMNNRKNNVASSFVDVDNLKKQIVKFKNEEDRYNKAYGMGLFSVEQLKEYVVPLREKITALESQIAKAAVEEMNLSEFTPPSYQEIEAFCKVSVKRFKNLNFEEKQSIIRNVVEKVVGNKTDLQVDGRLSISLNNYVGYKTITGDSGTPERGKVNTV